MQINVLEQFNETCKRWPHKTAVVDKDGHWDFETLQRRAFSIAHGIAKRTDRTNQPIAVHLSKSREALAAILGILYSGNCYAPLDPKTPLPRLQGIVERLVPILLITNSELNSVWQGIDGASDRLLMID